MRLHLRTVALLLSALLFVSALPAHALTYEYFPDVPDDLPYAEAVNTLTAVGLFKGDENGNFNPDKTITRAEFSTIMCRLLDVEEEALDITLSSFDDVPSTHWACGYVTMAVELGLVNGYGNGRFGPSDFLTYEQAIKVLVCACEYDEDMIDEAGGWPNGYIAMAEDAGALENVAGTVGDPITRSSVAILICNMYID